MFTAIGIMEGLLRAQSKLTEAGPYCREAVEKHRRVLGDENQHSLMAIASMGSLLYAQGIAEGSY